MTRATVRCALEFEEESAFWEASDGKKVLRVGVERVAEAFASDSAAAAEASWLALHCIGVHVVLDQAAGRGERNQKMQGREHWQGMTRWRVTDANEGEIMKGK